MTWKPSMLGPVSSDTLNPEHTMPVMLDALRDLNRPAYRAFRKEWRHLLTAREYMADDMANCAEVLIDEINSHCPPYIAFSAHPDDGACLGFWPDIDLLNSDDEVPRFSDLSEIPPTHRSMAAAIVNDHGNVTYGYVNSKGKFREIWSCV